MKKVLHIFLSVTAIILLFSSCEDFLNPEQELDITEDKLFDDWYEYRSVEMGMYALQQKLVEQIVVLGELRGDLLKITENADADLVEIYNFNVSKTNKYASPTNFFKLIAATNNFIRILQKNHPEVLDANSPVTNYDRLYGEALCMRAWTYFTAVRIYGKVPFIHESLTTIEEIEAYINSSGEYVDSVNIVYDLGGYYNDTIENQIITLEKQLYDEDLVIDYFTNQLENELKAVGVNHHIDNNDRTWDLTIWNTFAYHALLGHMYLTAGDFVKANEHFEHIIFNNSENNRYQLASYNWPNMFYTIDESEHIFVIWFNKANFQQNGLQNLFDIRPPHQYKLKPTKQAVDKWETEWNNARIEYDPTKPTRSKIIYAGSPGDRLRGQLSYLYFEGNSIMSTSNWIRMMELRRDGDIRGSKNIMEGMDTVAIKYWFSKNTFDQDANFALYRAAGIHLYLAEIYTYWESDFKRDQGSEEIGTQINNALGLLNNGSFFNPSNNRVQLGVRGRVNLDPVVISGDYFIHDPNTNKVIGYKDLQGSLYEKQKNIEEEILDERARELAFEGERFYDLMRVARRRNDPSFLAEKVAAKFPAGKREEIYNLLLDENNWYIRMFD